MFDKNLWVQAKKHALPLSFTILLGAAIAGLIVWQAWLISQVINRVFLYNDKIEDVQPLLVLLLGVILIRSVAVIAREISAGLVSISVKTSLREKLFKHLLEIGPRLKESERTGELSSALVQGIEKLDAYFRQYLPQLALSALVPLIILIVLFPLDWLTGLVFLLTAPLIPLFMVLIARHAEKETRRQWRLLSRLSNHFQDVLVGLTTLKSFGRSKQQTEAIQQVSDRYADATLKVLRVAFLSALVLELLATLSTAIVAVQIGLRLLYGQLTFINAIFILILAPEFYLPLRQLGASFHSGMEGITAAGRIFDLLEKPPQRASVHSQHNFRLDQGVALQSVSYAYEDGDRPAITQVSFELAPGETTALVGLSGAGKSTIVKIIAGFLEPYSGKILVGDQRLTEINLNAWRDQLAWVPQSPYLFHSSIEENIRLAKPGASDAEIVNAAQMANADEFIRSFPGGYQTQLGERGARLSGGQAQRIALARAFLKDAPLVVLDEPGANLDVENQEAIQDAWVKTLEDRIALIIAHRISTMRLADKIVVLDGGRVIQIGTFQQLQTRQGQFQSLIHASFGFI